MLRIFGLKSFWEIFICQYVTLFGVSKVNVKQNYKSKSVFKGKIFNENKVKHFHIYTFLFGMAFTKSIYSGVNPYYPVAIHVFYFYYIKKGTTK